ncbi:MAG: ABC transporter permease [Silvanigrellales bacterium]|nr:ABC transporter permease [Silvanigrellales bacterium]
MKLSSSPLVQFFLLGLRGVLREKSVVFWSFLFPLFVTGIFVQAFSPSNRPDPFRLGVGGFAAVDAPWLSTLSTAEGVTLVQVDDALSAIPNYAEALSRETDAKSLPSALRDIFFRQKIDALLTPTGFFSLKATEASARDVNRILAAKARARGETLEIRPVNVKGVSFADWFAPGMIGLTILTGGLFGTSFRLTSDREKGLFRRYMLTPFRRSDYVLGFVASRAVFVVAQSVLLLGLFRVVFGFQVHGSVVLFLGLVCLGSLASNLLGAAIASRIQKSEVAGGVANIFFFPMMFLSGVYFRTENFPPWLKSITDCFSLSALNTALRAVANEGLGVADVSFEIGVLVVWAVACLALTVALFDWGQER